MTHPGDGLGPLDAARRRRDAGDLHGALDAYGDAVAARPDDPEPLFEAAGLLRALEQHDRALEIYDALALALPDLLPVLHNRAVCLTELGRLEEAIAAFTTVLAQWPEAVPAWAALGDAAFAAGRQELGQRAFRTAIALEPGRTGSCVNLGECLATAGDDEGAIPVLTRAARLSPDDPTIRYNRARSLLSTGRFAEGWREFEWRLHPAIENSVERAITCPRWSGEPLAGRHLFICGEQGIGDQIWFLPFARAAAERAAAVTLEVAPKLVALVQQSLPQVRVRPLRVERPDRRWQAAGDSRTGPADADFHIELGSLPRFLWEETLREAGRPVIAPAPALAEAWRKRLEALGPRPWIGVCWRSILVTRGRAPQYRPLVDWAPVLAGRPGTFVSLQHGEVAEELERFRDDCGVVIHPLPGLDLRDDVPDTAAAVASLDLVLCAPTWIANLSGALGVPTLMAGNGRWVGLNADRDPIHPAREIVCVTPGRNWPGGVMAEVTARAALRL